MLCIVARNIRIVSTRAAQNNPLNGMKVFINFVKFRGSEGKAFDNEIFLAHCVS